MNPFHPRVLSTVLVAFVIGFAAPQAVRAQEPKPFEPQVGQAGKDVVWVPTPAALVEKMLDMAKVTPADFVMDLGSGDGRNIIAAAKRGARALGVEYNPDMVELSRRTAAKEGVAERAQFVQGDMFEADISKASVMALFLLPDNMNKLQPKFLELRPGSRIVGNTFGFESWEPDARETISGPECASWCTSLLWIVPAKVAGSWRMAQGDLALEQEFQVVKGTLTVNGKSVPVAGKLRGEEIAFTAGDREFTGRVTGTSMSGTVRSAGQTSSWSASR